MSAAEELRECADAAARVCSALVRGAPEALEGCVGTLEGAARQLAALAPRLHEAAGIAEALAESWRLRRHLRVAGALLENAADYHRGWSERMAVRTAGYGPGGAPGAVVRPGHVWVEA